MSYKHLTIKEREMLMLLRAKGLSIRAVALRLGRNPSTISRELKRCAGHYSPSKAENDYHQKRKNCHKKRLLDSHPQLRRQITNGLIREYFPKRTDIDNYTKQDVKHCQKQLNQRPRKVLNYETPYEVFFDKTLHLVCQFASKQMKLSFQFLKITQREWSRVNYF